MMINQIWQILLHIAHQDKINKEIFRSEIYLSFKVYNTVRTVNDILEDRYPFW